MKKTRRKLIAPIIITILLVLYFISYIGLGVNFIGMGINLGGIPLIIKMLFILIPLGLMILSIYLLYERIGEIKGGEEDDLSKY